jgi:hypothetical protein
MTPEQWLFGSWAITASTIIIVVLALVNLIGGRIERHLHNK